MKIRNRLLILLLSIALGSLVLGTAINYISVRRIGVHLASQTRVSLLDRAHQLLHTLVDDYDRILARDESVLLAALALQAHEVEDRLAAPPPRPTRLYFTDDFDRGVDLPEEMILSERHLRPGPDGQLEPIPVNYRHQVIFLPHGVARRAVEDDLARLSTMPSVYHQVYSFRPDLIQWQFTALESGVHTSYPAKGGYPADYDPRRRQWYREARQAGGVTRQFVTDLTTRELMMALSVPVYRPDGAIAGVTAIDIVYARLFGEWKIPPQWAAAAETLIVSRRQEGAAGVIQLETVLVSAEARHEIGWKPPVESQYVRADDPREMEAVLKDVGAGISGVRKVHYKNREVLWAYGASAQGKPFPLVIVPYDQIVAEAAQAEVFVREQIVAGLKASGLLLLGLLVLVSALAVWRSRTLTLPVQQLAQAARRLAGGDFGAQVDIRTDDELQELGDVFNDMGPSLAERERMKQSLGLAKEIQQYLLPQEPPHLEGFDIAGGSIYCDETGGDYYDFIELGEAGSKKLGLAVGDVSGHGIGAALVMTTLRGGLRSHAGRHGPDLGDMFASLNRHLVRDTSEEFFMTLFYGVLDGTARTFNWVSAGHGPVFWLKGWDVLEELPCSGIPLGIMDETTYETSAPTPLRSGDILLIGTDGIWETVNPAGEMFGTERLCEVLAGCREKPAADIYATIMDAVRIFRAEGPQEDDITMVIIKALDS